MKKLKVQTLAEPAMHELSEITDTQLNPDIHFSIEIPIEMMLSSFSNDMLKNVNNEES